MTKSAFVEDPINVYPPVREETCSNPKGDNNEITEYAEHLKDKIKVNNKLLLIQVPQFDLRYFNISAAKKKGYYAYPPTGLQYLASALKDRDLEIEILDLNYEILSRIYNDETFEVENWLSLLDDRLESFPASMVGVSCIFDTGIKPLLETLNHLKEKGDAIILAGGVVPTYDWEKLLAQGLCHFVCEGESENKINFLLDYFLNDHITSNPTPGIRFKYQSQFKQSNGPTDVVDPKGNLISTYRLIPIQKYHKIGSLNPFSRMAGTDRAYAAIILNRGCRAACTFCAVRDFNGKGVRSRSVEETLEEIIYLNLELGIKHFEFLDDDFLRYKDLVFELFQGIIENKLDITWSANNGLISNSLDDDLLEIFEKTNCTGFRIGIESGNAEILKTIQKPASLPSLRNASILLRNYQGLFVCGNIIIGFTEETFCQMLDSFWFSIEMDLDWSAYTICQIIRGASAFENFTEYFSERMNSKGDSVSNFIPSRDSKKGEILIASDSFSGMDIFHIPPSSLPNKNQLKEIWFAFNLVGNFINNKNLKPDGRPEKFIGWVKMAQVAYPQNPYMYLFLALAYRLIDNESACKEQYDGMLVNLENSDYWKERFNQFGLSELVENFPQSSEEIPGRLNTLRRHVFDQIKSCIPSSVEEYV